jgi:hypothetical protein
MHADNDQLHLTLYDRHGNNLDQVTVLAKR